MSVYVSGMVWKHSRAKGGDLLTLLAISEIAGEDGFARPQWDTSIARLSTMTRLSRRAVQYCIRNLEEMGELAVHAPGGNGRANTFQVILDRNHNLFDGPAEPVDKSAKSGGVQSDGGVQPASRGGCKMEQERVQPAAPDPSVRLSRLGSSTPPGPEKPVDKNAAKKPGGMPKHYAEWVAAGISAGARAWAKEQGLDRWLQLHWDFFVDYIAQPAQWKRYTDLDAAFRNCMRSDWGDVRMKAERAARANGKAPGGAEPSRPVTCRYCQKPWAAIHDGIPACGSPEHIERARKREPSPEATHA